MDSSGPLYLIKVYLSKRDESRPDKTLLNATIDLSAHVAKESCFRFSRSIGLQLEHNCLLESIVEFLPETKLFN